MNLSSRFKPKYLLKVRVRGPRDDLHRTLWEGDALQLTQGDDQAPTFLVKFHGKEGVEIVQLAPALTTDIGTLRDWAAFIEQETK